MNKIKRLFCDKIEGEALEKLAEAFGCQENLRVSPFEGYSASPKGVLDIKPFDKSVQIELGIKRVYFHRGVGTMDMDDKKNEGWNYYRRLVSYDELKEFLKD